MGASVFKIDATGVGLMNEAASVPVGQVYRLISVSLKLSSAPSTSENFTVTLDANTGSEYDVLLYSVDPAAEAVTDVLFQPEFPLYLVGGDAVDSAWTNTDARTWGLSVTFERVG